MIEASGACGDDEELLGVLFVVVPVYGGEEMAGLAVAGRKIFTLHI